MGNLKKYKIWVPAVAPKSPICECIVAGWEAAEAKCKELLPMFLNHHAGVMVFVCEESNLLGKEWNDRTTLVYQRDKYGNVSFAKPRGHYYGIVASLQALSEEEQDWLEELRRGENGSRDYLA